MDVFSRHHQQREVADFTKRKIQETLDGICSNRLLLLEIVAGGPFYWRRIFYKTFRGLAVNEDIADLMFALFKVRAGENPANQLDQFVPKKAPPTDAEIDAAWEHDWSHTSEEARRLFYKDEPGPPIILNSTPNRDAEKN